jgi:hypothetical protein
MPGDHHFETMVEENTLVAYWVGEPTAERLEAMVEQLRGVWRKHQTGVYLLNVITENTGIPDSATRRAIAGQFESMRNRLRASAIVLEKDGIDGTMSRAILSTLVTISRRPFDMKVFSTRDEAASWLARQGGSSARSLAAVIERLEGRLSARMRVNALAK